MSGAVEKALKCLGKGFDVTCDFRAKYCKGEERLVLINEEERGQLVVPGFGSVGDVSVDVKCDKGDRIRYRSDVLEFNRMPRNNSMQMSELFNQQSGLAGKIPSGLFNKMFGFRGSAWVLDAANTKSLAVDGYFISLFKLRIDRQPLTLADHLIGSVPQCWDPAGLATFIENYGTHIIVGLSVGGQDVVYVKQDHSSNMSPSELHQHLDKLGDQLFTGTCPLPPPQWRSRKDLKQKVPQAFRVFDTDPMLANGPPISYKDKDGLTVICSKRGGDASASSHSEWLPTIASNPDVINFSFVPITSLLKGVPGTGFLTHAINLYLRYKPPLSDLKHFLDFQYRKEWAPMHNDLPLAPNSNTAMPMSSLQFNMMSPKLYVNTTQVTVGRRPVTGMRLHLEGKKNNRLAVHLEHLSTAPLYIADHHGKAPLWRGSELISNEKFYEPVQWKNLSRVCIAPVKYDPEWSTDTATAFIVTGVQLHVEPYRSTNVLHLRLLYSEVPGCLVLQSKWEELSSGLSQKSGFFSTMNMASTNAEKEKKEKPAIIADSAIFPTGPPVPVHAQKLLRFVDTSQINKGPKDSPGHWLVTGAKLDVDKGRICLHVKFSLLSLVP